MGKTIEDIKEDIAKYEAQIKRVKKVIPLVTITVVFSIIFFCIYNNRLLIAIGGIIAMCMYAGSFVWAYLKSKAKIKELEEQLKNLNQ